GRRLLAALGREGTPVVEAIASEGVGVVDTLVTAVRAVARTIQLRSEGDDVRVDVRRAETPDEVLAKLAREHVAPEWAAELFLEQLQAALVVDDVSAALAADEHARAAAEGA